jgi:thiamine-phosphate pyrophosphorylase
VVLYYITDRHGFSGTEPDQRRQVLRRIVEASCANVDYIQLREKDLDPVELELLAREALHLIRSSASATKFLINSRAAIALAIGADGVHLPAGSLPPRAIREKWKQETGLEPTIGVSAHTISDLQQAELQGANFALLAPIFEKVGVPAKNIGLEGLRQACTGSGIPVLALGGITLANAKSCLDAGARGIAGIRLFQQGDVSETVARLRPR